MTRGDPASHRAQSSSPIGSTEMFAALVSSAEPIRAPGPATVPKPGVITAPAAVSRRRLGVSAKRASRVARLSSMRKARIRPSPSNQWVAFPPGRRNLPEPLR